MGAQSTLISKKGISISESPSGRLVLKGTLIRGLKAVFTATCFSNVAVMGSLDVSLSVRLSVCDVGEQ